MKKQIRDIIIEAFQDTDAWTYDGYYIFSNKHFMSFWVANGLTFFQTGHNATVLKVGFLDKFILYPKAKKLIDRIVLRELKSRFIG